VPIVVKGRWDAPRIYPDIPQILENPEAGFARLREAGALAPPAEGN
jgi:AsmA protein